ncbi:peroxiredoxin-6-like isoform X2 [Dermacentor albipictus]|uniref:peroxiredoxin-6-like isoform X2 n=1 Tax=Dermacentor albipictus TaxID=60249 RepID=UPI0038FC3184
MPDIIAFNDLRMNDLPFPIISDEKRELAVQLGMLDPIDKDNEGIPLTCRAHTLASVVGEPSRSRHQRRRIVLKKCCLSSAPMPTPLPLATIFAVFIIGPDKKLKLSMLYPATSGRNFPELFRAVASLKLTEEKKVATPANWMPGEACMVIPSVKDEEIPLLFPKGVTSYNVPSGRKYIRVTPQPDP